MAETQANPQALAQQIYFLQNPQASLQFQRQQALAQQLMDSGNKEDLAPNTLANPGGYVINQSPLGMLGKALEKGTAGYLQGQNNAKLAEAMQQGIGGQQQSNPQGQALGNAMDGSINSAAPVTGSIAGDAIQATMNNEAYKAAVANKYAALNEAAKTSQTPVNMNGHMTFMTPPALGGQMNAPQVSAARPGTQLAETGSNLLPNGQPDDGLGGLLNAASPSPQTPSVDFNNPVAVKQAETTANKQGENIGDNLKTLNVMSSNLPMVLQRFDKMRGAAKDASYGAGTTAGEDGSPPPMVTVHDMLKDKTAQANGIIQQTSAQGVLPELGPTLAQAGIKGNKFLETLSSNASAIPLHQAPEVKLNTINGLESQYINNLKSTAQQVRNNGGQAPSDADIDAAVAKIKSQSSGPAPETKTINGVTYTKINGQWHQ